MTPRLVTLATAVLLAVGLSAAPAHAYAPKGDGPPPPEIHPTSVSFGQTVVPTIGCESAGGFAGFQEGHAGGVGTYAPISGVITSWSYLTGDMDATASLRVYRSAGLRQLYDVIAETPAITFPATTGLHTIPVRIPVSIGAYVGLHVAQNNLCAAPGAPGDSVEVNTENPVGVGQTEIMSPRTGTLLDLSVTIETDADGDGYGDLTQDRCPQSAALQTPCQIPNTRILRRTNVGSHSRFVLSSKVQGVRFSCALDKGRYHPCGTGKHHDEVGFFCQRPGQHTLYAYATSPLGISDPTPARYRYQPPFALYSECHTTPHL